MQDKKISLVIPAYNEAAIIKNTIEMVLKFMADSFADYELIISDDGSTDKTRKIVEGILDPHVRCVGYSSNRGKGSAVRVGILAAAGDVIAYTDADLAYGIDAVGQVLRPVQTGAADIAIGSRKLHPEGYEDYPLIRLLASRFFSFLTGLLAGFRYDTQCGLKAFSAQSAKAIFNQCETDGFAFDFEVMMLAKSRDLKVCQIPVKIMNHRESKINVMRDSIKMFGDIIRIRSSVKRRLERETDRD